MGGLSEISAWIRIGCSLCRTAPPGNTTSKNTSNVANAGNVELWLEGKSAGPLGVRGERRTLRLDALNWQSYLR